GFGERGFGFGFGRVFGLLCGRKSLLGLEQGKLGLAQSRVTLGGGGRSRQLLMRRIARLTVFGKIGRPPRTEGDKIGLCSNQRCLGNRNVYWLSCVGRGVNLLVRFLVIRVTGLGEG